MNVLENLLTAPPKPDTKWYMAGTESTGEYIVIGENALGRIGFRVFSDRVRIRIEAPGGVEGEDQQECLSRLAELFDERWKQPSESCPRISLVVNRALAREIIERAMAVLVDNGGRLKRPLRGYLWTWVLDKA
jgi:hypothetical protein